MWNPLSWVMEFAAIMAIVLANGGVRLIYIYILLLETMRLNWIIVLDFDRELILG